MQFAPQQKKIFHKRHRSVPRNRSQLKAGEQAIEEEEKKEDPVNITTVKNKKATDTEVEREMTDLEIMKRELYDPEYDTVENYSTIESEYGADYTNKRFSVINMFLLILSSELDMPWVKSLFDRTNDFEISTLNID